MFKGTLRAMCLHFSHQSLVLAHWGSSYAARGTLHSGCLPPGYVSTVRGRARFQMPNRRWYFDGCFRRVIRERPITVKGTRGGWKTHDRLLYCTEIKGSD